MTQTPIDLPEHDLISTISVGLNGYFYANSREESKRIYTALKSGKQIKFMQLSANNGSQINCDLTLDTSQYLGKLNFSKFRKGVAMMMMAMKQRLDAKQSMNMLTSDNGDILFNVPGIVKAADGTVNVIVTGFRQIGPGRALVRLMYLNPKQYIQAAHDAREKAES